MKSYDVFQYSRTGLLTQKVIKKTNTMVIHVTYDCVVQRPLVCLTVRFCVVIYPGSVVCDHVFNAFSTRCNRVISGLWWWLQRLRSFYRLLLELALVGLLADQLVCFPVLFLMIFAAVKRVSAASTFKQVLHFPAKFAILLVLLRVKFAVLFHFDRYEPVNRNTLHAFCQFSLRAIHCLSHHSEWKPPPPSQSPNESITSHAVTSTPPMEMRFMNRLSVTSNDIKTCKCSLPIQTRMAPLTSEPCTSTRWTNPASSTSAYRRLNWRFCDCGGLVCYIHKFAHESLLAIAYTCLI